MLYKRLYLGEQQRPLPPDWFQLKAEKSPSKDTTESP